MKQPGIPSNLANKNTSAAPNDSTTLGIDVRPTIALHERLRELLSTHPVDIGEALTQANRALRRQDRTFDGGKDLSVAISALSLSRHDIRALQQVAETLHDIVERVLAWIFDDQSRLDRYFADHRRMFSYLAKTDGWNPWQAVSRYDVVLTESGEIKILELNTGCPAGFMHARSFTRAAVAAMDSLGVLDHDSVPTPATIRTEALADGLLKLEAAASITPGLIGLLNDENKLRLELDLLAEAFDDRGREARIISADELEFTGGRLLHQGDPISLTHNKFRISTPTSKNHFWKAGFEDRYAAFLAAQQAGAVVSANNLTAMTIAEDKSLLALFSLPEVEQLFDSEQRQFIARHLLWTSKLEDRTVTWQGRSMDLLPLVRKHREEFVIKPCNEGRGFGVVIGRDCPPAEWNHLCDPDANTPRIVQQYVEPLVLPVVRGAHDRVEAEAMYLTLGLAVVLGQYEGVLSRVSPSRITNVAREGFVQAVFQRDDS